MSRHRLYRNYDFEEDLDEYDGDEYLEEGGYGDDGLYDGTENADEEDEKAFLEQSKRAVLAMLGEANAAKVPSGKAEEAILYYDYNEEKAVAYLMRTFVEPPPPVEKKAAAKKDPNGKSLVMQVCEPFCLSFLSVALLFGSSFLLLLFFCSLYFIRLYVTFIFLYSFFISIPNIFSSLFSPISNHIGPGPMKTHQQVH